MKKVRNRTFAGKPDQSGGTAFIIQFFLISLNSLIYSPINEPTDFINFAVCNFKYLLLPNITKLVFVLFTTTTKINFRYTHNKWQGPALRARSCHLRFTLAAKSFSTFITVCLVVCLKIHAGCKFDSHTRYNHVTAARN